MVNAQRIQQQGALDWLCGVYAIANALAVCDVKPANSIFKRCLAALPRSRWPTLLWEGICYEDLERMLGGIGSTLRRHAVVVTFPFEEEEPSNADEYWQRFDNLFDDERSRAAIVGLRKPHYHWIVARPKGRRTEFIDSMPAQPVVIKNRAALHVGKRNKRAKWLIDPGELILFQKGRA